jgi:hypothetical protein
MLWGAVLPAVHRDLYDDLMADSNRSTLWLPRTLWERYATVVGDAGRTADLKIFMDWQIDHTDTALGPDVAAPYDFLATLRMESERWEMFMDTVGAGECSARLRSYIQWRIEHPDDPLPGRRLGPLRRQARRPALV